MENQAFFETIVDCLQSKDLPWGRASFNAFAGRCGYAESCLDAYDEAVEYRRILLSHYYHAKVWADEVDFDGKSFGHGSDDTVLKIEAIMRKREAVAAYIKRGSLTWGSYRGLVDKYGLAT